MTLSLTHASLLLLAILWFHAPAERKETLLLAEISDYVFKSQPVICDYSHAEKRKLDRRFLHCDLSQSNLETKNEFVGDWH